MVRALLLFLSIYCCIAHSDNTPKTIETPTQTSKPENTTPTSEALLVPQNPIQVGIAVTQIMKCGNRCDPKEVKKAADAIVKNGYKIPLVGTSYGKGMQITFHPNTTLPEIVKAPEGSPDTNRDNSEAALTLAKAVRIPELNSNSGNSRGQSSTSNSPSLRSANVSSGSSGAFNSRSGSNSADSHGHSHGGSGNSQFGYNGSEAILNESPLSRAQNEINSAIASVPSKYSGPPLAEATRNIAVDSLINVARNSIALPAGNANLNSNPLYNKIIDDLNGTNINTNLKSLVRKDLNGEPLRSNFSDIKSIALSASFQQNAGQFIGGDNLKDFNLAAIGAEILLENDATPLELLGINKSLGSPYDKTIAKFNLGNESNSISVAAGFTGVTSYSVFSPEEWIELSRNLSNPSRRMLRPENFNMEVAALGIKSLEQLIVDLNKYNSLDLLNAVTVPMSDVTVSWTKEARERILLYLVRMKKLTDEGIADGENAEQLTVFKTQALALQKELVDVKVMLEFYNKFEEFFSQRINQEIWQEYASSSYNNAKRSLAIIRFSLAINGLRKKNYEDAPTEPMSYLISVSFNELNKEKVRKKRALDKEQREDALRLAKAKKGSSDE